MTTEEMRNAWRETSRRLDRIEEITTRRYSFAKKQTSLDRLRKNYKIFAIIGLNMTFVSFLFLKIPGLLLSESIRILGTCLTVAYFAAAAIMDLYLYSKVGEIDVLTMSVREVRRRAVYCRKRHHLFMAILLPWALCVLGVFGIGFRRDIEMVIGGITGGIIGGCIGTMKYREMMRDYKNLMKEDKEDMDDEEDTGKEEN